MSDNNVWVLSETGEASSPTASPRVFQSRDGAVKAALEVISEYRNDSRVADEIDNVLAEFTEAQQGAFSSFGAGDGSCMFYVQVEETYIEE
jgi:hypothetical protein